MPYGGAHRQKEGIGSFGARVIGSFIATTEHGCWGTELGSSERGASAFKR